MNTMSSNESSAGRFLIWVLLFSPLSMIVGRFQIKMIMFMQSDCWAIADVIVLSIQCDYRQ